MLINNSDRIIQETPNLCTCGGRVGDEIVDYSITRKWTLIDGLPAV
jgi:hypothetical protein